MSLSNSEMCDYLGMTCVVNKLPKKVTTDVVTNVLDKAIVVNEFELQ